MRLLILLLIFIFAVNALAASPLRTGALPMFQNGDRSFVSHSTLGPVCSSIRNLKNEPACNAALLGEDPTDQSERALVPGNIFGANLFFGHDYETVYKNRDLISGDDKMDLAQNLLSEKDPIRFEASTLLWWRGQSASLSFQPMRWTYFSDVRNQSYPDVAIHGMQEQSLQGQLGGYLSENWRVGVQLRYLERKFVYEEFNLFTAIPHMEDYLQVRSQKAFFVEPGIAYELSSNEELRRWRPLLSLNVSQSGWLDQAYEDVPVTPIVDSGLSVLPPVANGDWELALNYRYTTYVSTERKLRLGSLYRWGFAQFQAGVDEDEWSLGLLASFRRVGAGVQFKRVQIRDFGGEKTFDQSTSLELRCTL